jgi:hypothetical protein
MIQALEVLFSVYVTVALGYGAARHGQFGARNVLVLNKVVLLYAIPMSISADRRIHRLLTTGRHRHATDWRSIGNTA